jgi:hypothetical protein
MSSFENVSPRKVEKETPGGRAEYVAPYTLPGREKTMRQRTAEITERKQTESEDSVRHEVTLDRIQYGSQAENTKKLEEYAVATIKKAQNTIQGMKSEIASGALNADSFEFYRQQLAKDRDYLMQLQQYGMTLPDSPALKKIMEESFQMVVAIEEDVHTADMHVRQKAIDANLARFRPSDVPMPSKNVDPEAAAMAAKFNTSAAKIEKQKKGIWGRIKGFFS